MDMNFTHLTSKNNNFAQLMSKIKSKLQTIFGGDKIPLPDPNFHAPWIGYLMVQLLFLFEGSAKRVVKQDIADKIWILNINNILLSKHDLLWDTLYKQAVNLPTLPSSWCWHISYWLSLFHEEQCKTGHETR